MSILLEVMDSGNPAPSKNHLKSTIRNLDFISTLMKRVNGVTLEYHSVFRKAVCSNCHINKRSNLLVSTLMNIVVSTSMSLLPNYWSQYPTSNLYNLSGLNKCVSSLS